MSLSRLFICALTLSITTGARSADQLTPLNYPVCEPSAALLVPCIDNPGQCVLVGDNETADAVFLYPLGKDGLDVDHMRTVELGKNAPDDIESMARLDDKTLLFLGSHSRNNSCKIRKNRQRLMRVSDWGQDKVLERSVSKTPELSAAALLDGHGASSPVLTAVGEAIDQAEALANKAAKAKKKSACEAASAFNIEGAVAIPGATGDSKVWIGLRSPLVSYAGKTWAALLRLERPDALGFDQAILLDLGGRGLRELTLAEDWLWGIAGGPGDGERNFVLWKVKLADLRPDAQLEPRILRSLPNSSEGLVIAQGQAIVLIDGDRGKDKSKKSCQTPGAYLMLDRQSMMD